ncbi:hypothetical protein C6N75_05575 [Streptomyces solincola]|uniref:HTH luxR-type domain-containing protein n=1 Tax=Streptomyces solincola TaxID=2100817 RepID=A0A2S9Q0M3_9ACTN|nr:helix-turn-helix domain-containing protein [Streptomyces solincola]PRH80182.1 hypothetical protein C6N75_05575 [Streptomyces solincola]
MIQGELTTLGLGRTEERAYAALLRHRGDGAEELARKLGLPRRRLDAALDRLVRHGFASPPDGGGGADGLPRPAQPAAIRSLIHRRQAELHLRSAELERLRMAAERLEPPDGGVGGGGTEPVTGPAAIAERTARLLAGARQEIAVLDRAPHAVPAARPGPGVAVRAVLAPGGPGGPPALAGPGVRTAADVPVRLLLVDRRTALLPPADPDAPDAAALLVREGLLCTALLGLFDSVWERAEPPGVPGPERELLALLAAGLKDEAIARRLGVHVHTARRRISRLLDTLDARTRFQAGARASVRGWLEGP